MIDPTEHADLLFGVGSAATASGVPYSRRFKPAAATLGFAFNDKAVATVARELGTPKEKEGYEKRSLKLNSCKLSHGELLEGGELCFVMGEHPSNWAREDQVQKIRSFTAKANTTNTLYKE